MDDLISRQAAIELACWRCKKCEKKDCEYKDSCETMKLLDALPSEDPKPPMLNNDCISRQQAVEAVTNTIREKFSLADWYEQLVETGLEIENLIKELPPVTPTERTGEWIKNDDYVCDQCGYHMIVGGGAYNFCPNCGAKMGGRREE